MAFKTPAVRRRLAAMVMALVAMATAVPARVMAQGSDELTATDPVVSVAIGPINKLTQDVNYLTGTVGQAQVGGMFSMMAGMFTSGLDTTRPSAVIVPLVNGAPQPIALVPVLDLKMFLKRLEPQIGPADELDDGTLVIAVGASTVFIREVEKWAVLAPQKQLLDLAPSDPAEILEGIDGDYDLSVRLQMQQVPTEMRELLTAQIRQGYEQAMAQQQNSDAEAAREMAESSLDQLEQLIEETDELSFGFNVNQTVKQVQFNGSFTAVPGSDLAAIYGGQQAIPSRFSSVIREDAAAYYHGAASIAPEAVAQTRTTLKMYLQAIDNQLAAEDSLDEQQRAELSEMIERISDLALASIEEGKADVGALLLADQNDFRFVFGSFVADGNEAAQIVKDLAEKVQNEPGAPTFKFDVDSYKGVNMHVVESEIPPGKDEARQMFGDALRVHIGTGDKAVFVALGNGSEDLLKELIDQGDSDTTSNRPVGQLKFTLLPILQYAQSIETNDAVGAMINALSTAPDPGVVTIVSQSVENGAKSQVSVGEGLLRAVGAAIQQSQQAAQQQF